jgi:hypothetical protein
MDVEGGITLTPYFDKNMNICFDAGLSEISTLLSDFSAVYNKYEPMSKWFNDPDVPQEQKDAYKQQFINAMQSMSFYTQLLKKCGVSDEKIKEYMEIPF